MDAVTYSNDQVKAELEFWNFQKVDGDQHPDVMNHLKVSSFPSTVFLSPDGKVREVVEGGMGPGDFLTLLRSMRERLSAP